MMERKITKAAVYELLFRSEVPLSHDIIMVKLMGSVRVSRKLHERLHKILFELKQSGRVWDERGLFAIEDRERLLEMTRTIHAAMGNINQIMWTVHEMMSRIEATLAAGCPACGVVFGSEPEEINETPFDGVEDPTQLEDVGLGELQNGHTQGVSASAEQPADPSNAQHQKVRM